MNQGFMDNHQQNFDQDGGFGMGGNFDNRGGMAGMGSIGGGMNQ